MNIFCNIYMSVCKIFRDVLRFPQKGRKERLKMSDQNVCRFVR